jgi:hypothetical protein
VFVAQRPFKEVCIQLTFLFATQDKTDFLNTTLNKFLKKLVNAEYITPQTATMLYNRYFPTTKASTGSAGTKATAETKRISRVN